MPRKEIDSESKKLLEDTLNKLKGAELLELLKSLLSSAEMKDISRRIMAAKLLKEDVTYSEITHLMGMSASTVNKIYFKTKGSPIINNLFKKD